MNESRLDMINSTKLRQKHKFIPNFSRLEPAKILTLTSVELEHTFIEHAFFRKLGKGSVVPCVTPILI